MNNTNEKNELLKKIYSVKDDKRGTHKVITVAGIKIKIRKTNLKQEIEKFIIMNNKSLDIGIPQNITLQLCYNNDCNCKCNFCSIHNDTKKQRLVMPEKWLYEYFKPIYENTKNLNPTYGEITKGIEGYNYISFICKNYPHINIYIETNGIAFDEKWRELAAENLFTVNVSINAIDEESFKKTVWDKDGIYTLVHKNVQEYINLLDEKGLSAFRPGVSSILNSTNYQNLEAFIKMVLEWKIQKIVFYFDTRENNLNKLSVKDKENFDIALTKLLEIERILKDKVYLGFRLFMPIKNIEEYEKAVNEIPLETLKEKYSEIWNLAKNLDLKNTYYERVKAYKAKNKKLITYFEFLKGVCWHSKFHNNYTICENSWNHIRLRPDGRLEICAWRGYRDSYKIQQFIENDTINFKKLFNDFYHRKLRQNFKKRDYSGCMKNCPAMANMSLKEYEEKYINEKAV